MTDLEALYDLQQHDTALDQLRHRRAHLPERTLVAGLTAELTRLGAEAKTAGVERDALGDRQARLEGEVAACERHRADIERKLAVTSVPREAQTMSSEIDGLRARQSTLEDELIEIMEALEPIDGRLAEVRAEMSQLDERLVAGRGALADAESEVDAALAQEALARAATAAPIPASLIDRYEKLRTHLGGIAVAKLDHNRCTGCNLTLPTLELERFRSAPPDEVVVHEECGRILVR